MTLFGIPVATVDRDVCTVAGEGLTNDRPYELKDPLNVPEFVFVDSGNRVKSTSIKVLLGSPARKGMPVSRRSTCQSATHCDTLWT